MRRFEYKIYIEAFGPATFKLELDELGKEGWEYVGQGKGDRHILKRPLEDDLDITK